ncbi:MAG: PDZ domain-containing protein, partial [Myxococcales bacterium]|nr:PDZ domain-containing protein [Myxococcales bacterium]
DIALIKIKLSKKEEKIKWPYLPLGDSDTLRLGDPVMALGSPLGLVQSVNTGIISQKHRGGIRPSGRDLYAELIQMQMPINPGNSGGPVIDPYGRVVGVSESILASGQAIAFCVPINIIKAVVPQLLKHGKIEKAFLGVEPTDLTPQYAKALGLSENVTGAVVVQVLPDTPAEKAGMKAMDVILEIDDLKVADSFNLRQHTAYKGVGQSVIIKLFRKGSGYKKITIKLEKRKEESQHISHARQNKTESVSIESVGLEVMDTSVELRKEMDLSSKNPGVLVVAVLRRSAAEFASLLPGDVITEVNGETLSSAAQLKKIVDNAKKDSTLMMLTRRGNAKRFVPLER